MAERRSNSIDLNEEVELIQPGSCSRRAFVGAAAAGVTLAGLGIHPVVHAAPELMTMSGEPTSLFDNIVSEKWNLVMMWSVDCGICAVETPTMSDLYDAEKDGDITVLGLSIDGKAAMSQVSTWMQSHQMRFPNLVGELIEVASNYLALTQEEFRGTPTFLLFNPKGDLAAVQPGPLKPEALKKFIAAQA